MDRERIERPADLREVGARDLRGEIDVLAVETVRGDGRVRVADQDALLLGDGVEPVGRRSRDVADERVPASERPPGVRLDFEDAVDDPAAGLTDATSASFID